MSSCIEAHILLNVDTLVLCIQESNYSIFIGGQNWCEARDTCWSWRSDMLQYLFWTRSRFWKWEVLHLGWSSWRWWQGPFEWICSIFWGSIHQKGEPFLPLHHVFFLFIVLFICTLFLIRIFIIWLAVWRNGLADISLIISTSHFVIGARFKYWTCNWLCALVNFWIIDFSHIMV